jgi:hypothetical protein
MKYVIKNDHNEHKKIKNKAISLVTDNKSDEAYKLLQSKLPARSFDREILKNLKIVGLTNNNIIFTNFIIGIKERKWINLG